MFFVCGLFKCNKTFSENVSDCRIPDNRERDAHTRRLLERADGTCAFRETYAQAFMFPPSANGRMIVGLEQFQSARVKIG